MPRRRFSAPRPLRWIVALILCWAILGGWPAAGRADTVNLVEKPWEQLPNHDVGPEGQIALTVRPAAWLHGESQSWILHYRRITEAKRVALEIDFYMNFVAKTLGAKSEQVAHKANVFIFEDEKDWQDFKAQGGQSYLAFAKSFALGENLFLNVRNGATGVFNSQLLAHETTHATVRRIFSHSPPLWLSEGFAEEMSGRGAGARMGQYNQRLLQRARTPRLGVDQLLAFEDYPTDPKAINQLYENAEKLVRFLMTSAPPETFQRLFAALVNGEELPAAIPKYYGNKYPTYAAFVQAYQRTP